MTVLSDFDSYIVWKGSDIVERPGIPTDLVSHPPIQASTRGTGLWKAKLTHLLDLALGEDTLQYHLCVITRMFRVGDVWCSSLFGG